MWFKGVSKSLLERNVLLMKKKMGDLEQNCQVSTNSVGYYESNREQNIAPELLLGYLL